MRYLLPLFLLACSAPNGNSVISVYMTSDFAPSTELSRVETTVLSNREVLGGADYFAFPSDDFDRGALVAQLEVAPGDYEVRVRAYDPEGVPVAEVRRFTSVGADSELWVEVSSECVDVACTGTDVCSEGACVAASCADDSSLCVDDPGPTEPEPRMPERPATPAPCDQPLTESVVLDLTIANVPDPRYVDGYENVEGSDLDRRASDSDDSGGCNIPDFVDPVDRNGGVDNQLASLEPTLDSFTASSLDEQIYAAGTRLAVRLEPRADTDGLGCVDVTFETEDLTTTVPAGIEDGLIRARLGSTWRMPNFLGTDASTRVRDLHIRVDRVTHRTYVSGIVSNADMVDALSRLSGGPTDVLESLVESVADQEPNRSLFCSAMSVGFEAVE